MSTPRLSICIPTFNRAEVLNECLGSIVPQCIELGVEICISDNASEDHTVSIVEAWRARYPNIRLNRHEKNLRIDRNIVAAGALATGDVIWFLSDDDILQPQAVADVLAMVDRYPSVPSFIVNRQEYDETLLKPVADIQRLINRADVDGELAVSLDDALVTLGEYLGYLPAWVIRRTAWTQIEPTVFLDTDFVHVGVGLAGSKLWAVQNGYEPKIVISNHAIIRCRLGRASWRNRHYEIWIRNWQKTMRELGHYLSREAVEETIGLVSQRNYLSIVSGRGFGPYGLADYNKYLKAYIPSTAKRVIAVVVALSPRWSAKAFTRAQRFVREALAR